MTSKDGDNAKMMMLMIAMIIYTNYAYAIHTLYKYHTQ